MKNELKESKSEGPHDINLDRVARTQREINNLLEHEETMWRQKLRHIWLRKKERNSWFFITRLMVEGKEIVYLV